MGSKAPSIKSVNVNSIVLDDGQKLIESVDVGIHVDYSGGFAIGIDVLLAYGKTAFLSAKSTAFSQFWQWHTSFFYNFGNVLLRHCEFHTMYRCTKLCFILLGHSCSPGRNPSTKVLPSALLSLDDRLLPAAHSGGRHRLPDSGPIVWRRHRFVSLFGASISLL